MIGDKKTFKTRYVSKFFPFPCLFWGKVMKTQSHRPSSIDVCYAPYVRKSDNWKEGARSKRLPHKRSTFKNLKCSVAYQDQLLFNPIRPRRVLFAIPSSKSITNLLWMGISISIPDGFLSWRYMHCLLRSKKFLLSKYFRNSNFLKEFFYKN